MTVFIYALKDPETRRVRYIGKTRNLTKRFQEHLRGSLKRKSHLGCWLRSLDGDIPNLLVLREVPEAEGSEEEMHYIRVARMLNIPLTNATDGGEGVVNPTAEVRAKHSAAMMGRKQSAEHIAKRRAANIGKKRSAEARAKDSAAKMGEKNPNFGKKESLETRAKKSASMRGKKHSLEQCAKQSAAMSGVSKTPEHCANMRAARKGIPWSPAQRAAYEAKKNSL